ncbi:hypothetical protein K1719_034827 [Acacia pycnantha]|nr:hypothetical protein K1719_034827 [Acacia pycnantha]
MTSPLQGCLKLTLLLHALHSPCFVFVLPTLPLHLVAYFLNPKFYYDSKFNLDFEVKTGLWKTLEKMCLDIETRITIDSQLEKFDRVEGLFGNSLAIATRDRNFMGNSFGDDCKELQTIAIRILSLTCTCSATGQKQREEKGDTYDPICLSDLDFDEEWITEQEDLCLMDGESWMDIHECFNVDEGDQSKKRKRDDRNNKGKGIVIQDNANKIDKRNDISNKNDNGKGSQIVEQDLGDELDDFSNEEDEGLDMPELDADSDSDNISLDD